MTKLGPVLGICCTLLAAIQLVGQERAWTDSTGSHEIIATLVSHDANIATLKKKNGVEIVVPLVKLSKSDVEFLKKLKPKLQSESLPTASEMSTANSAGSHGGNPESENRVDQAIEREPLNSTMPISNLPTVPISSPQIIQLDRTHFSSSDLPPRPVKPMPRASVLDSETKSPADDIATIADLPPIRVIAKPTNSQSEFKLDANPQTNVPIEEAPDSLAKSYLADLAKEPDMAAIRRELLRLKSEWPAEFTPELAIQLATFIRSQDKFIRKSTLELLAAHDASQSFPLIVECINDTSFEVRWRAYEIIESLGDERAIGPLIKNFTGEDRSKIASLLQSFGSKIEDGMIPFLQNESRDVRLSACGVLARIGTQKSVATLSELSDNDSERLVRMQAKFALSQIADR